MMKVTINVVTLHLHPADGGNLPIHVKEVEEHVVRQRKNTNESSGAAI
jgi:hypothetical protein